MRQLAEREIAKGNKDFEEMKHHIDNKGTVIFTLGNGGSIKDSGKQVWFSKDKVAQEAALSFAKMKWGKNVQIKENSFEFVAAPKEKMVEGHKKRQERGLGAGF